MSEDTMIDVVQAALDHGGIADKILAVGQFEPRGSTGAMFAGGMIGSSVGGELGEIGDAIGTGVGALGGLETSAKSSGLPMVMLVGVSESTVYGFKSRSRHHEPHELVFRVPRAGLTAKVHQRVNVRVLELINEASGSCIELEGSRIPLTHSKDVIALLTE
jgi:hypothetical protein